MASCEYIDKQTGTTSGEVLRVEGPMELSINSVVGLTTLETMKIRGHIGSRGVIVLIDCGASHNFVSKEVVQQLAGYEVKMGTG